jgi:hypothetical protein
MDPPLCVAQFSALVGIHDLLNALGKYVQELQEMQAQINNYLDGGQFLLGGRSCRKLSAVN